MKNRIAFVFCAAVALLFASPSFADLFTESFESGYALSGWSTDQGDVGWVFNSETASHGTKSLMSNLSIQTDETAVLEITIATNRLKFDYKGDFKPNDKFYLYIDGQQHLYTTYASNWTTFSKDLEFGLHTFKWVFKAGFGVYTRYLLLDNIRFGDELPGNGTKQSPYLIDNAPNLNKIGAMPDYDFYKDKYFRLSGNIGLNNYGHNSGEPGDQTIEYNVIGKDTYNQFSGHFDGNGFSITNLTYSSTTYPTDRSFGLFGYLAPSAVVENLRVAGFDYTGMYTIGGIAAVNYGTIINCETQGIIKTSGRYGDAAGGITATNRGLIKDCTANIEIIADWGNVGGIAATNYGGRILDCTAVNNIYVGDSDVSGIARNTIHNQNAGVISGCTAINNRLEGGYYRTGGISSSNYQYCTIVNCRSEGTVKGYQYVGGIVGDNSGTVLSSSSSADVIYGYGYAGGAIGENITTGTAKYCYATGDITASGGIAYSTGGFCGLSRNTITQCFSTGYVQSGSWTFGFIYPYDQNVAIVNCFFDYQMAVAAARFTNNEDYPFRDAEPLTTAQMTEQSIFEDANWDFEDVWQMSETMPQIRNTWPRSFVYRDNGEVVDQFELAGFVGEWMMNTSYYNSQQVTADYNKDGVVDLLDWAALAAKWTLTH